MISGNISRPFKILHTSDWHLGKGFKIFGQRGNLRLANARYETVDKILRIAEAHSVDAVLCAGDVFHDAKPEDHIWKKFVDQLHSCQWSDRVLVLLPGMHDPLLQGSPYSPGHPFRRTLPNWVHVVDKEKYELEVGNRAVLHAVPCHAPASEQDPTELLPRREGDKNMIRIGLVHGRAEGIEGYETNYPVSCGASEALDFDYIALGERHDHLILNPDSTAPMVYAGTPEIMTFNERDAGTVSVVMFVRAGRKPQIQKETVSRWIWREIECRTLEDLRKLCSSPGLEKSVIKVYLDFDVSLAEFVEVESLLEKLGGTKTRSGRAGVLRLDASGLRVRTTDRDFSSDIPEVVQGVIQRLKEAGEGEKGQVATRALLHLYRILHKQKD